MMKTSTSETRKASKYIQGAIAFGAIAVAAAVIAKAGSTPHWGYGAENGPKHWSAMSSDFELCGTGKHQSPIDIPSNVDKATRKVIAFDYRPGAGNVVNNGHSIQVNVAPGSSMTVDGTQFKLLQFHFHTPSENTIDGLHYPMEAHLVHKSDAGQLAVVSVMVRDGAGSIVDELPKPEQKGGKVAIKQVDATRVLPANRSFKSFTGSLTTPPCSEGVAWFVMNEPIEASNETIADFYAILGANNRPTHPLNGRNIIAAH